MVRIGLLATLAGPYTVPGEEGTRGATLALQEFNHTVAGQPVELVVRGTNAIPDSATGAAEALLNDEKVDFIVGPLSGNEALAIREMAKTIPDRVFINGSAGPHDLTLRDPAPNFFSFSCSGFQWSAGSGQYGAQHYKRVVTIGEDYSFPHAVIAGFALDFCKAGGQIVEMLWCALGTRDYTGFIEEIATLDVDAVYVALGGQDGVHFLQQYRRANQPHPIVAGVLLTDESALNADPANADVLIDVVSSGPSAGGNPSAEWQQFAQQYRRQFPDGLHTPSLFARNYYVNMKAALLGLQAVNADLSGGQARFADALRDLTFDTPTGSVRLDKNRNAIADNFVRRVERDDNGKLCNVPVQRIPQVTNTYGIPEAEFLAMGVFNRHNMPCGGVKKKTLQDILEERKRRR